MARLLIERGLVKTHQVKPPSPPPPRIAASLVPIAQR
jgi:hypothetical protein